MEELRAMVALSNKYGQSADYVLAGGGNTSFKKDGMLWVKASGTRLGTITEDGFVQMEMPKLLAMLEKKYPAADDAREAAALADMMAAIAPGGPAKRPSVESILHAMFPYSYVVHLHPALANGLTCGQQGAELCKELFGDQVLWVPATKPGYILGKTCHAYFEQYRAAHGKVPQLVLMENHGMIAAADTPAEADALIEKLMDALKARVEVFPDFSETAAPAPAQQLAPALRMLYRNAANSPAVAVWCGNTTVMELVASPEAAATIMRPFTPDHIVYCGAEPLYLPEGAEPGAAYAAFIKEKGYAPRVVLAQNIGFFALAANRGAALTTRDLFLDAVKIAVYSRSFGGPRPMSEELKDFIIHWEAESYRAKAGDSGAAPLRMQGRVCLVTGAAQGFGEGIARGIAAQGGSLVLADMNEAGAKKLADELCAQYGAGAAVAASANVADEDSVREMVYAAVLSYGGLDLLVSCAGIAIAGGLDVMTKANFEKVTAVNYTGYFLCAKYGSEPMKIQRKYAPDHMMDIIEINSKSGLEGSKANFAYAGSKFGGIGLTQSFALELAPLGIKVNAICPGNLLDGPLWSDPERGLFKQYLDAGKVPGAKTVADVRKFYEDKVPMGRGCTCEDVATAVLYLVEQKYETGQALPVTGGQVMLS
ncbi:SDR family oxidoreductase [Ruminococcaceae bacterium OttesenSCG-928-D13]|nr:SDR family oxidoreductase [Ruminococcaceae bacterium OttesenSCG-928-D13]